MVIGINNLCIICTCCNSFCHFYNDPTATLVIHKYVEGTENEPLSGVAFKVTDGNGGAVGPDDGIWVRLDVPMTPSRPTSQPAAVVTLNSAPGSGALVALSRFWMMSLPRGWFLKVIVKNSKKGSLIINKKDSATGKPLEGVEFKVATSSGQVVADQEGKLSSNGIYFTNKDGQIVISGLKKPSRVLISRAMTVMPGSSPVRVISPDLSVK